MAGSATIYFESLSRRVRGSLYELETQIQLCHDLDCVSPDAVKALFELCNAVARMINGLLKTLKLKDTKQSAS